MTVTGPALLLLFDRRRLTRFSVVRFSPRNTPGLTRGYFIVFLLTFKFAGNLLSLLPSNRKKFLTVNHVSRRFSSGPSRKRLSRSPSVSSVIPRTIPTDGVASTESFVDLIVILIVGVTLKFLTKSLTGSFRRGPPSCSQVGVAVVPQVV